MKRRMMQKGISMDKFSESLYEIYNDADIYENEPMSRHTTFKAGGPAKYYVTPVNEEQIRQTIKLCRKYSVKYYVIGRGSNLLVKDKGFEGLIIEIGDKVSKFEVCGNEITAGCGIKIKALATIAKDNSLAGMEFMYGIPGTLGGAVAMNAGAYGGEIKDILKCVTVMNVSGEIKTLSCDELELGYRKSNILKYDYIVLKATISLNKGDKKEIEEKMADYMKRRRDKQPLEYPSAGSTFKRPKGYFAGKLIEDAGLGGYRIGGAMVSDKHCGFIINYNNAGADDIQNLIAYVQKTVNEKFGVMLEPEVRII